MRYLPVKRTPFKRGAKKSYKTKAQEAVQLLARLRDTDADGFGFCISCGKEASKAKGNWQGGHYYDKGLHPALATEPDNVHLQCRDCNYYGMNDPCVQNHFRSNLEGKLGTARLARLDKMAMEKDNPDVRAELFAANEIPYKYTHAFWEGRLHILQGQVKKLKKEKDF